MNINQIILDSIELIKEKCKEDAYIHSACAVAQYEEDKRRIKQANENNKSIN